MLQRHDPDDVVRALLDTRDPSGDPIVNAVRLLMTGFGYNFYDAKNVARANDQLVRAKAAGILGDAGRALARLEYDYRAEYCPPPSREQPFLPVAVTQPLKKLERVIRRLADVETRIRAAETPATDMIWFRVRNERWVLEKLLAFDVGLAVTATDLGQRVAALDAAALAGTALDELRTEIDALDRTFDTRAQLMTVPT